jgi:hypothetical protein
VNTCPNCGHPCAGWFCADASLCVVRRATNIHENVARLRAEILDAERKRPALRLIQGGLSSESKT